MQRTILVQAWRPTAFWASCSSEDDLVAARVRAVNAGCSPDKEVIRPGTIKEYGTLNVDDFKAFNAWLLEEEKPTYKGVVTKLAELRHHRWATWHVMCPDNPSVDDSCSMPCSPPAAFTSGEMLIRNWFLNVFLCVLSEGILSAPSRRKQLLFPCDRNRPSLPCRNGGVCT